MDLGSENEVGADFEERMEQALSDRCTLPSGGGETLFAAWQGCGRRSIDSFGRRGRRELRKERSRRKLWHGQEQVELVQEQEQMQEQEQEQKQQPGQEQEQEHEQEQEVLLESKDPNQEQVLEYQDIGNTILQVTVWTRRRDRRGDVTT